MAKRNEAEALDLLVFGAHPDDAEIGMAGTMAKHAAAGLRVGVCDLTRAELSSNGNPTLRAEEAEAASRALGLAYRSNLGLPDRGLVGDAEQLARVVREIRERRPRFVFAPYWKDRHPDHVACSALIEAAAFNAKLRRWMPDVPAWTIERLYFYFINDTDRADVAVDVTDYYEAKTASLAAYRSQFEPSDADAVATPLTQGYLRKVEQRDSLLGNALGVRYAEGFAAKQPQLLTLF
ncbi:bacillithiol biosynthesis deacetylase BshB1 [Paenibacillus antri]|uniref:Bacillithiol biosynthesis deacetylase BshB1 n=1 Tax=Paenibacillus antri TaxID=2582848 RepID=A0A5R9GG50_9BACL|nr:bacillithiol biosynthesis deacetylase BshB1 [Paenibacillus antri]TLS53120.1 bacillithiol biosynthesis deacetylase BshB1 [Paenibacillus antri]